MDFCLVSSNSCYLGIVCTLDRRNPTSTSARPTNECSPLVAISRRQASYVGIHTRRKQSYLRSACESHYAKRSALQQWHSWDEKLVSFSLPFLVGIIRRPVLGHAPLDHRTRWPQTFRFVTSILEEQRDDAVRWNIICGEVSHCNTIVGVRPEVLSGR